MNRAWMAGLLLLPACASARGEEFVGRDRTAGGALSCAMQEAGRLGYQLASTPLTDGTREGGFRAERWLSPRGTGVRSLGIITVSVVERAGEARLRIDPERFEEEIGPRGGGSGAGMAPTSLPGLVPGRGGGTSSVDSVFGRGGARQARSGMKRVGPGPVGGDAARIRAACSETSAG